jgi:outer membrane protein assembly factor BamB
MRFAVLLLLSFATLSTAADWPQWLGPKRDASCPETIAPWKGDLQAAWRKPVGEGNSSPVVAGGLVFIASKVKDKDIETVQAFDAKTGDLKWEQQYAKTPFKPFYGEGPRATPTVHEGTLYTLGNTGRLIAWEAATGKKIWDIETLKKPKENNLFFGISASPLIVGDRIIVLGGTKESSGILAFDRKTGAALWTAGKDQGSYASPRWIDDHIVALTAANVVAISPTGSETWAVPFKDKLFESSTTPIKIGDIYIAASVTVGAIGIKIDGGQAKQIWKNDKLTCYFSTPVPVCKDHVYMVTGGISTNPSISLHCVEAATGKIVWTKPGIGKFHAALLTMADGNLLMHLDKGELLLLAPDAKEYKELARSKACGETWAHPAIADGKIYLRDAKELICLETKSPR